MRRSDARIDPDLTPAAALALSIALAVALGHAALATFAVREKSCTCDELAHVTDGYTFDRWNDYRMDVENGVLPQRWQALLLSLGAPLSYPALAGETWRKSAVWFAGRTPSFATADSWFREIRTLPARVLASQPFDIARSQFLPNRVLTSPLYLPCSSRASGHAACCEVGTGSSPVRREVEMFERDKQQGEAERNGGNVSAFLGPGTRVTGKLEFDGPVRIESEIEGEIIARDTLSIGESAVVKAQLTGTTIVISGRVTGDVTTSKRLEIRASAKLSGSISTPTLVINEGGSFDGQCTMRSGESQCADKDKGRKVALVFDEEQIAEVPAIEDRHVELSE